jgi:hypothetical protein
MQRTTPTPTPRSPQPSSKEHQQQSTQVQQDPFFNQDHDQGQNQSQVHTSLPSHLEAYSQDQGQDGQQDEYNDAPPPSSQIVKYTPPQASQASVGVRVISLPPLDSFPPSTQTSYPILNQYNQVQSRNQQGYHHQQQGEQRNQPQRSPNQQHVNHSNQGQQRAPINLPSLHSPPSNQIQIQSQTPNKNPFANAPPPPSPTITQSASSPLQTPNRPSDPNSRLSTDPVPSKQLRPATSEGSTYTLPPPPGKQVQLGKRSSKGLGAPFKVPFPAGSPGQKELDKEKAGFKPKDGTENEGQAQEGVNAPIQRTPGRGPSADEQRDRQIPSEKSQVAVKRAEAVKVS